MNEIIFVVDKQTFNISIFVKNYASRNGRKSKVFLFTRK